jgi:predicted N-acetyltransferase YhbS
MTRKSDGDQVTFEYRTAVGSDAANIFDVLQNVASEVPVSIDDSERQERMKFIVKECCDSGESLVAVDGDGSVVGFVLAKPDRMERFQHDNQALSLRYIGVGKDWRRRGVFAALMARYTAKGVPLTASVLQGNKSAMVDRLAKIGFAKLGVDSHETKLKWQP